MEEEAKQIENSCKVLEAWDTTVSKLKNFVPAALLEMGAQPAEVDEVRTGMDRDALLFVPVVKQILKDGSKAREAKDITFFKFLLPAQFHHLQIPKHIADKGFLFFEVFEALLNDLEG